MPDLGNFWHMHYHQDNKDRNLRLFKLKQARIFDDVDDNLFKEKFDFTSEELASKLINVTSKKDNQMIIDHIEIKRVKIFEQVYGQYVIQPPQKRTDLLDTVKVFLDFNKTIQPYLTQK